MANGRCGSNFKSIIFKRMLRIKLVSTCEIALRWMPQNTFEVNIGSGKGLVPSGNKPLPEHMLTLIYVDTWCH